MTNIEKFKEVFGFEPDEEFCILHCPENNNTVECPYYEELDGGCHGETWWHEQYTRTPTIDDETAPTVKMHRNLVGVWVPD